ncbi:hypothetical protein IAI10_18205 [Clostridium sp. 19966]|uniref:hypothetical protein n=1 Tax=Clostridium sp. 19966 TaxID=2768166 RepID=UPI0028DDA0D9|nr:hypothetical protein [Clostridium sp. 19966]MDT8718600.1 hypothetical protein [Clostridium sp. 19966]
MDISKINEGELGYNVTVVTLSGNKIQGSILNNTEDPDVLKLKTEKGIVIVNSSSIESIY